MSALTIKLFAYFLAYIHSFCYKPQKVQLDICNMCQLDCAACWMRKSEELIKKTMGGFGYIKFETFKSFIDKHKFIKEIDISHCGEIFLNPDFNEIIKYAHYKNIRLSAKNGVNMNHLTEEMAENLVKYQFHDIYISIDGASQETYSIYRRKGNFNNVIDNIRLINKFKDKYNSKYPELNYKFIIFGHNEHEIEKAKQIAKNLNMGISFIANNDDTYSPVKNPDKVLKETNLGFYNETGRRFIDFEQKEKTKRFFCSDLFFNPYINFNGDLFGCCVSYKGSFRVNVFNEGLLKALRHKNVIHAKAMILSDFLIKPKKFYPCLYCAIPCFLKENNLSLRKFIIKNFF